MFKVSFSYKSKPKKIKVMNEDDLIKIVGSFIVDKAKKDGQSKVVIINKGESINCEVKFRPN